MTFTYHNLIYLQQQGIDSYEKASTYARCWVVMGQPDFVDGVFFTGSRDLCWHLSWLLECLETGKDEDTIAESYDRGYGYYMNSKYGVKLYHYMWGMT